MGVREPRIPLRYLQIDPAASRHGGSPVDHVTVVCSVTWPLNESEAGVDLVLIDVTSFGV